MRFYSGKSAVTSLAYTHMESFSARQCPWAVTGEGGQILRAAVAVRAAYTLQLPVEAFYGIGRIDQLSELLWELEVSAEIRPVFVPRL